MLQNHDCKEELNQADLKATPARLGVLGLLEKSDKPLDVAAIIAYLEKHNIDADQATVFRIVNMFTERGLAKQIHLNEGKSRYELAARADHHHLICNNCGDIEDISDCGVAMLIKEIQTKKGFHVKSHSLEFFGICKQCQH